MSIQMAANMRPSARNSRTVSPGPREERAAGRRAGARRLAVEREELGRRAAVDGLRAVELVRGRAGALVAIRRQ
jgi:hypothetical protein